jgi:hypothetical protein
MFYVSCPFCRFRCGDCTYDPRSWAFGNWDLNGIWGRIQIPKLANRIKGQKLGKKRRARCAAHPDACLTTAPCTHLPALVIPHCVTGAGGPVERTRPFPVVTVGDKTEEVWLAQEVG